MGSSRNSAFWCGLVALAGGWPFAAAAAESPCANPEIEIQADQPADIDIRNNNAVLRNVVITQCDKRIVAGEALISGGIDFENSRWELRGKVSMKAEGGTLDSATAVVTFRNKLIAQAIITGEPAEFTQPRADGTVSRGRARTIEYETTGGTVTFRDDAWLSYGCNEVSGQVLTYDIRAQRVVGRPADAQTAQGRITFRIQPKDQDGAPCAPKAADPKP